MKTALLLLLAFILLIPVSLAILGQISKSGSAPGLVENKLNQCPDKPNCVCSEYRNDSAHFIAPIEIDASHATLTIDHLKNIIEQMGGKIEASVSGSNNYVAATFSSNWFGFVDDFEVYLDNSNHVIQVRSAARVGQSDLGVNRKRVELFRKRISQRLPQSQ